MKPIGFVFCLIVVGLCSENVLSANRLVRVKNTQELRQAMADVKKVMGASAQMILLDNRNKTASVVNACTCKGEACGN